jgi:hypothetical protein
LRKKINFHWAEVWGGKGCGVEVLWPNKIVVELNVEQKSAEWGLKELWLVLARIIHDQTQFSRRAKCRQSAPQLFGATR